MKKVNIYLLDLYGFTVDLWSTGLLQEKVLGGSVDQAVGLHACLLSGRGVSKAELHSEGASILFKDYF